MPISAQPHPDLEDTRIGVVGLGYVVLAVPHAGFASEAGRGDLRRWTKPHSVIYDAKSALEGVEVDGRL
ncbi:hypothetical protein [Novilysobacter selenitireducens]|uniref:Gfo/Idh/MocA-like oxidoreductase N-terminal domain-containing protein n=1 Tax=Novilysobacter selenitireducens TaxID=2872639 RepID=A0ABS7T4K8_9GAMM|nr:hypothetical protein [Lysobacter selenitireducens]MBZ4038789.1 hypothetical protein [Lysobacter selenitireducens]